MLFKRAVGKGVGKVMSKAVSKARYAAGEGIHTVPTVVCRSVNIQGLTVSLRQKYNVIVIII